MTIEEQCAANLNLKLISYAIIHGKLYWLNDTKKKRIISIPSNRSTSLIYGGLFLCEDYENNKHKLHAYYNNSIPFTGNTVIEDLYDFSEVTAIPIVFSSLKDIEQNDYKKGIPVECSCFVANFSNRLVGDTVRKPYHKMKGVDAVNFIKSVKEKSNGS